MNDTPRDSSGWTIETYSAHNEALRMAEEKFQTERDRRYEEVAVEREKALRIKEEADKRALDLQAETQTYKDEKANELREQINSERGSYLTREEYTSQHKALEDKIDAQLKPLAEYVAAQVGRSEGIGASIGFVISAIGIFLTILGLLIVVAIYFATH